MLVRFGGELAHPDFFLGPEQDARAQPVRLHQAVHESDLSDRDGEEEPGEFRERVFAQVPAPVEVVTAREIAAVGEHRPLYGAW